MNRLLEFTRKLRRRKARRAELRFVTWAEGDRLVREGWRIAKEEDHNRTLGMVYVERLEPEAEKTDRSRK